MKCDQCEEEIAQGATYIYHTESALNFCDHDCCTKWDMDWRQEKVCETEDEEEEYLDPEEDGK